ncbi:PREDICTED: protein NPC2 homolog [Dinoponera quadriceps]|uniref:Protein NPC2 homolog n=1 Tax=Dinoponera quadriceps TaxID=609295 RepID=A0A6P3XVX4_DINQU|nr:PREDICTED: protein NPC2 homolog [Dinoponera quadriceps]
MSRAVIFALFCAVLCSCYGSCVAYVYEDCGSTLGKFSDVSVTGCQTTDENCALKRGTNATISIKFKPNAHISQVLIRVYGVMLDIPIPFPLDKPDMCKDPDCGVKCPLEKDQEYTYTTTMYVQRKFPSVNVYIKWEFVDDKENKIVCVIFPARITT